MVKVILDERPRTPRRTAPSWPPGWRRSARLVADADLDDLAAPLRYPPRPDRAGGTGFRDGTGRDGDHPHRGVAAACRRPSPNGWGTCSTSSPDGWIAPAAAGSNPATSTRCDWPGWPRRHRTSSRVAGREMVAGAHALAELPDEITTPGPRPDPGAADQLRQSGDLAVPTAPASMRPWQQLDLLVAIDFCAAREPSARALAAARGALAGTRGPAGVHQQHARRAVSSSSAAGPSSRRRRPSRSGGSSSTSRWP